MNKKLYNAVEEVVIPVSLTIELLDNIESMSKEEMISFVRDNNLLEMLKKSKEEINLLVEEVEN